MIAGADERDAPSAGMVNGDAGGVLEDAERQLLPSRNCRAALPEPFRPAGASAQVAEAARFSGLLTMWHGPCHTHSAKPALGSVEGLVGRGLPGGPVMRERFHGERGSHRPVAADRARP